MGGVLGLAVLATLASTETSRLRQAGHSTASSLTGGYHLAFLVGALLVLASIAVAAVVLRPRNVTATVAQSDLGRPDDACYEGA